MTFDLAVASPAARVRETLDGVADGFGEFNFPLRYEQAIYLASAETLFDILRKLPDGAQSPLLVGHNPGLQRLILDLAADGDWGPRTRVADGYPTGAVAVLELPAVQWAALELGSGTLTELILPKELD
jgi:phosphohistidine phosphatase